MSYGPVSNDDLLQYYGFVERDNPSDAYVLEDMGKWLQEVCLLSMPPQWTAMIRQLLRYGVHSSFFVGCDACSG